MVSIDGPVGCRSGPLGACTQGVTHVYIHIHTYVTYIWGINDWRLVVVRGLQHYMLLETGVEQLHRL